MCNMMTVDGTPVRVIWRGKLSARVETLDGSLIHTDEPCGFTGAASNGFVNLNHLVEVLDDERPLPFDRASDYVSDKNLEERDV